MPELDICADNTIEKHQLAAEAIRSQAELLELAHDAIIVRDPEDRVTYWNQGAESTYGWTREEALGRVTHELLQTRFPSPLKELMAQLMEKGQWDGKLIHTRKDGREIVVASRWAIRRPISGNAFAVLEINRDVTEHEQAVRQLQLFKALVDNSPDFIGMADATGKPIYVNPAGRKMVGLEPDFPIETTQIPQYYPPYLHDFAVNVILKEMTENGHWRGETFFRHWQTEKEIPVSDEHFTIRNQETTQVLGYGTVTRDISDLKEAEMLRVLNERLKKAATLKDEFLATLSHELRTPLASVLMWTQMLKEKRVAPDKIDEAILAIEKNALAQNQLIGDLLDVTRILSGKLTLELEPADLNSLIQQAIASVTPAAMEKSIRIITDLPPQVGSLRCDPTRIKQIVWNLLTNAIKFSDAGAEVFVKTSQKNGEIKIRISDKGAGISADFQPYLFQRFSQQDSSLVRKHGGLGLGLSIVHDLVTLHGGTVAAESAGEGLGATFTVTLPTQGPPAAFAEALPSEENRQPESAVNLEGLRILVVDDSPDSRLVLQAALESMNAEVKTAGSAKEGFIYLQEYKPDVLLSDISMPDEDGISFIRKVRQLPKERGREIPAIALTAYASRDDAKRFITAGFQSHLPKPVEFKKLGASIANLIFPERPFVPRAPYIGVE